MTRLSLGCASGIAAQLSSAGTHTKTRSAFVPAKHLRDQQLLSPQSDKDGVRLESSRHHVRPTKLNSTKPELTFGSYNRYLAIASRVVRRSLKEDKRLQAERRGEMDLRFAKWEVSLPDSDLSGSDTDTMQNGKQGENKPLGEANAAAMAEHAEK